MGSLKVGSLFTGVGGFDLAFESVGMSVEWQVENDRFCREVLRKHWPGTRLYGDVRDVTADNLGSVELICGGFPCQDLSVAGERAGLDGERSGLWHEYLRIADSIAPRWICIENVPGLLSSNDGKDFAVLLCGLTGFHPEVPDGGWGSGGCCEGPRRRAFWRVLDTQYFGPPQRRRRVFIVADARGECGPEILFEPSCLPGHPPAGGGAQQDATGGARSSVAKARRAVAFSVNQRREGRLRERHGCLNGSTSGTQVDGVIDGCVGVAGEGRDLAHSMNARDRKGPLPSRDIGTVAFSHTQDPDATDERAGALSHTGAAVYPTLRKNHRNNSNPATESKMLVGSLTSSQGGADENDAADGRIVGPIPRRLTPRECERLHGFPDDWTAEGVDGDGEPTEISDTQRYKQMGNAVSVPVAAWVGQRILEQHEGGTQ